MLWWCCSVNAFAQWTDDFTDGEFVASPVWVGDTGDFTVNSFGQLQLNATDPATSRLAAAVPLNSLSNIEWRFSIQLGFSPSSSNYARVYLVSDRDDLNGNGYFLQFGEALSNDAVELFRQDGNNFVSVCRAANGQIATAFTLGVKVTRDDVGVWRLFLDTNNMATYHQVALGAEGMYDVSGWTGISCTYTSANSTRFYFDDFYVGPVVVDTTPPQVCSPHDAVFNEIYFEPDADALLPPAEYVEFYNRKRDTLRLAGWTLSDGNSTARFSSRCLIPPQAYWIVMAMEDTSLFSGRGTIVGLSDFPALNNDVGDHLVLRDATGLIIDEVTFSDQSYRDVTKRNGGWSVERIDTSFLCDNRENWKASTNPAGGTPGRENAVLDDYWDTSPPWIQNAWLEDSTIIMIQFSEGVNEVAVMDPDNLLILDEQKIPLEIIQITQQDATTYVVELAVAISSASVVARSLIADCPGNNVDTGHVVKVAFPLPPSVGDLVVNELLFDAATGTSDFIEVLNRSNNVLDLKDVLVAETGIETDIISGTPKPLTRTHRLLFPGEIFLFSEEPNALVQFYPESALYFMQRSEELPDFNTGSGGVVILSADGITLDRMKYDVEWHYPLLTEAKGVSLERTTFSGSSMERSTWHSASGAAGYATPGKRNSQYYESGDLRGEVRVDPGVFTPDNDGSEDVMMLSFHFPDPGRMAACRIFSESGRLIRFLINNEFLGNQGVFSWDGTDDDHQLVTAGRYIVFMETFSPNGQVMRYRMGCGVVY